MIISGPVNNEEIDSESAFDTLRTSTAVVHELALFKTTFIHK